MRMRSLSLLALACLLVCRPISTWGQLPSSLADQLPGGVPVLLQGEELNLPEDFVARLDGDQLTVALKSFGLTEQSQDRELLVTLIQDDGTVTEQRPDANGELVFKNVKEGLASLVVASGQAAYAAMAFYAVPSVGANTASPFVVPVAAIEPDRIREGIDSAEASGETVQVAGAARKYSDYAPGIVNRFQVVLQSDGTLKGRVIVPQVGYEREIGGIELSFFHNERLVGKTRTADDGTFSVAGLRPAIHSVFAIGAAGHSAFAFEVLPPKDEALPFSQVVEQPTTRLVSTSQLPSAVQVGTPADELIVLIIPPRMMEQVRQTVRNVYPVVATPGNGLASPAGAPIPGGFGSFPGVGPGMGGAGMGGGGAAGGGGMAGGGGAAGGIGGAAGLLGVAGLAAGVAAIADNSDGVDSNVATQVAP